MAGFEINHGMVKRQGAIASHCIIHRTNHKRGVQQSRVESKQKVEESTCFNHPAMYLPFSILTNTWVCKLHICYMFSLVYRIDDLDRPCIILLPTG